MSGLCRDCKHWAKAEGMRGEFGVCRLISAPCGGNKVSGRPNAHAHAMTEDGWWLGHLLTRPDFGCVQFEADRE